MPCGFQVNLLGVRPISCAASFQTAEVRLCPCPGPGPFSLRCLPAHNVGRALMASMMRPRMLLCSELGLPSLRCGVVRASTVTAAGGTSPVKAV